MCFQAATMCSNNPTGRNVLYLFCQFGRNLENPTLRRIICRAVYFKQYLSINQGRRYN